MIVCAVCLGAHQPSLVTDERVAARSIRAAPVDGAPISRGLGALLLVEQKAVNYHLKIEPLRGDKLDPLTGVGGHNGRLEVFRDGILAALVERIVCGLDHLDAEQGSWARRS